MYQLPDDVIAVGYVKTRPFLFEQLFYSRLYNFKGTEREFVAKGIAYQYRETDKYTRIVI